MEADIIGQGVELMVFGMGMVITFLCLLVLVTGAMSAFIRRYFPEPPKAVTPPAGGASPVVARTDPTLVAVISAAIHRDRSEHDSAGGDAGRGD